MPKTICLICGENVLVAGQQLDCQGGSFAPRDVGKTHSQVLKEVSDISGRSLCQIISRVFQNDMEIQQMLLQQNVFSKNKHREMTDVTNNNQGLCGMCYNLLEQVRQI